MVAILGPGGPSMATKIATNGPGGPVVAGDHLRRDRSRKSSLDNSRIFFHFTPRYAVPAY